MADTAFQTQYRDEFIAGFEKRQSLARHTVTTEIMVKGNEATFLVADTGDAEAVTRGVNGRIPGRPDNLNQYTAPLTEWHDKPERTDFNIFASQGDGRRIMQMGSMGVINRKIDKDIHSALDSATVSQGALTLTNQGTLLADILQLGATLSNNEANDEYDQIFALITPTMRANMETIRQFSSADYVKLQAFERVPKSKAFNWQGINWIVDAALDGVGTSTAQCYAYNKRAIGHACDMDRISTKVGYNDEDAYSWARTSAYLGSKVLQNSGIIKFTHDDSTIITNY